jgi:hypothetical protein
MIRAGSRVAHGCPGAVPPSGPAARTPAATPLGVVWHMPVITTWAACASVPEHPSRPAPTGRLGTPGGPATSTDARARDAAENNQNQDIQSPIALLHRDVNCTMPRTEQSELAGPLAAPPRACRTSSIASSKRQLAPTSSAAGHVLVNRMRSGSAYVEPDRRDLS